MAKPTRSEALVTPTGDRRHMPHIRDGRQSAEVFAKARLAELPRDIEVAEQQERDAKKPRKKAQRKK